MSFPQRVIRPVLIAVSAVAAMTCLLISSSQGRTPPSSAPGDILHRYLHAVHFGPARSHDGLTIIPICGADTPSQVTLLSTALNSGQLQVREIGSGRVNELEVENTGKTPVFIMAGQILVGAKQNRVLQYDLLLPPESGSVTVQAFCVQHGRWQYETEKKTFSTSANVSNPSVRQAASVAKAQMAVWHSVEQTRAANGAAGPATAGRSDTSDLNEVYDAPKVRARMRADDTVFRNLPDVVPDMQGAVVVINGRAVAADAFGDRSVFRRLWRPLLASYVLDGAQIESYDKEDARDLARTFLQAALTDDVRRVATPGDGVVLELRGSRVGGDSLLMPNTASGVMLHLDLFPGSHQSEPDDDEPPIQRRR